MLTRVVCLQIPRKRNLSTKKALLRVPSSRFMLLRTFTQQTCSVTLMVTETNITVPGIW